MPRSAGRCRLTLSAGALCVGLLAQPPFAAAQKIEQAALEPQSAAAQCFDDSQRAPARRVATCTAALDSGKLGNRERPRAYLRRAQSLASMGESSRAAVDYKEAIRLLDARLAGNQADSVAILERGTAYHALGDSERALADYDENIRLGFDSSLALVNRGILLATRKAELRKAISDFDHALALTPNNAEVLIVRADAYSLLGDHGRALSDLDHAVKLAPDNARARVLHGLAEVKLGNRQKAYADYTTALAIDPQNVEALVNRSALAAVSGDTGDALRDLDAAIDLDPRNALARFNRGYAHFARKDYETAIADYTVALTLEPKLGWAHLNRCLTRTIAGQDPVPALADCDEALKLMPADPEVRETRGFVYLKMGDAKIAVGEYDAALNVNSNRPLALYGRGLARVRNGDLKGGEDDKNAARALMPDIAREFAPYGLL